MTHCSHGAHPTNSQWRMYQGICLPSDLTSDNMDHAVHLLVEYFRTGPKGTRSFTGSAWDSFDPSGTRAASANTFTSDDLVSCELLSVRINGRTAVDVLGPRRPRLEQLLTAVGPDRDLALEPAVDALSFAPGHALWFELRGIHDLGATKTSKLMARKRPRLFPVLDKVVSDNVFHGDKSNRWSLLHTALTAHDHQLHKRLEVARRQPNSTPLSAHFACSMSSCG